MGDGSKQNTMDKAQNNGMSTERCASQIIKAIERNKNEVYIGGLKEVAGIYLKDFFRTICQRLSLKCQLLEPKKHQILGGIKKQ